MNNNIRLFPSSPGNPPQGVTPHSLGNCGIGISNPVGCYFHSHRVCVFNKHARVNRVYSTIQKNKVDQKKKEKSEDKIRLTAIGGKIPKKYNAQYAKRQEKSPVGITSAVK